MCGGGGGACVCFDGWVDVLHERWDALPLSLLCVAVRAGTVGRLTAERVLLVVEQLAFEVRGDELAVNARRVHSVHATAARQLPQVERENGLKQQGKGAGRDSRSSEWDWQWVGRGRQVWGQGVLTTRTVHDERRPAW